MYILLKLITVYTLLAGAGCDRNLFAVSCLWVSTEEEKKVEEVMIGGGKGRGGGSDFVLLQSASTPIPSNVCV